MDVLREALRKVESRDGGTLALRLGTLMKAVRDHLDATPPASAERDAVVADLTQRLREIQTQVDIPGKGRMATIRELVDAALRAAEARDE